MTGATFSLQPVLPEDAPALAELRVLAMRDSLQRVGRFDPVRARQRFLDGFSAAHTRQVLHAGQRVGLLVVRPYADGVLLLDHLYLVPQAQGRGLGSAVLRQVFAEADGQGLALRVGALRHSDANRFYLRHGFRLMEEAEWDNYYLRAPSQSAT